MNIGFTSFGDCDNMFNNIIFRIIPIIRFGSLYQEPLILDYEESRYAFFVVENFFE